MQSISAIFTELPYTPILLESRHAGEICKLIDSVRATLGEQEKHYLKPRSEQALIEHFHGGHHAIGVFSPQGQLIGCMLMKHLKDPFETANRLNFPEQFLQHGSWAIQAVAVHEDHGKQGLMPAMLKKAETLALSSPLRYQGFIAKVALTNEKSQKGFARAGFVQVDDGFDHAEGYPVVYLGRPTSMGLAADPTNDLDSGHHDFTARAFTNG